MTGWTAVVPLKPASESKTRLNGAVSVAQRSDLVEAMARHVLAVLARVPAIQRIEVLSARRPEWWSGAWAQDHGRGLNAELAAWRAAFGAGPCVIVHGDLPLLSVADVEALLEAARAHGAAAATDTAGMGTNALAIADGAPFAFRFGAHSRAAHVQQAPEMAVLTREGLARDIDTPADLAAWDGAEHGLGESGCGRSPVVPG